jgi:hypothetical protein
MTWIRVLETVHGHFGVLAAVALLHPAIVLRRGRPLSRGGVWSIVLTTTVTVAAFATGVTIYGDYREFVKPELFAQDRAAGLLFESKEHVAFVVVTLAVAAGVASLVAPRRSPEIRRAAAWFYAAAAELCLSTVALGTWVAAVRGFPS